MVLISYTEIFNSNGLTGASKFEITVFNTSLTMHNISGTNQGTINFDNGKPMMYQKWVLLQPLWTLPTQL
jgi:hypothetical protein